MRQRWRRWRVKLEQPLRRITGAEREKLLDRLRCLLRGRSEIAFAYVYGSILRYPIVRDVDVAIWLIEPRDAIEEVSEVASLVEDATGIPADVVILNSVDTTLRYHVFTRGKLLFVRENYKMLHDRLVAATILDYYDVRMLNSLAGRVGARGCSSLKLGGGGAG
jgi:predicted nucleotidyltransferase